MLNFSSLESLIISPTPRHSSRSTLNQASSQPPNSCHARSRIAPRFPNQAVDAQKAASLPSSRAITAHLGKTVARMSLSISSTPTITTPSLDFNTFHPLAVTQLSMKTRRTALSSLPFQSKTWTRVSTAIRACELFPGTICIIFGWTRRPVSTSFA